MKLIKDLKTSIKIKSFPKAVRTMNQICKEVLGYRMIYHCLASHVSGEGMKMCGIDIFGSFSTPLECSEISNGNFCEHYANEKVGEGIAYLAGFAERVSSVCSLGENIPQRYFTSPSVKLKKIRPYGFGKIWEGKKKSAQSCFNCKIIPNCNPSENLKLMQTEIVAITPEEIERVCRR